MNFKHQKALLWTLFLIVFPGILNAQYIPKHISHEGIYEFLDEIATQGFIELNSTVKPYSRKYIAEKLIKADESDGLSDRQKMEVAFYLKEYGKALHSKDGDSLIKPRTSLLRLNKKPANRLDFFYYRDSVFQLTANPILGGNLWSNENGVFHHWWNGVEAHGNYKNIGLFASLRDNHESTPLTNRDYMNQRIGASNIKNMGDGKRDYWEVRAGMTYAWKWGHVGLMIDQFSWGEANYGSNIFSGRTPAFAGLDLQMNPVDWFQFNYVHGWLVSEVVDSSLSFWVNNSYGSEYREVYHPKYLAANLFSFTPVKGLQLGVGNSVIYDYRSPHAAFFIPVMFWKALDHTLNARIDNMNSQLFFTVSSRNIPNIHLYASAFIDEVQVARITKPDEHNFVSYKIGSTLYPFSFIRIEAEYTWTNALAFRHYVITTTFESNRYNLGHYLEDNASELYTAIQFKPWRALRIKGYYVYSRKGPDHTAQGTLPRTTIAPLEPVVWESKRLGIKADLEVLNDVYFRLGYEWRNVTGDQSYVENWTPKVYRGKTNTVSLRMNIGF